jgi:hypothetical protein
MGQRRIGQASLAEALRSCPGWWFRSSGAPRAAAIVVFLGKVWVVETCNL